MNYELEIAFDFKNSKEYFVRYEPIELTDSEKIPEKLKNKKLYVFEKVKPKAKKYRNISAWISKFRFFKCFTFELFFSALFSC